MGYIFSYKDAVSYEQLLQDSRNGFIPDLQSWLMMGMLNPMKGQSVLGIGCGTGTSLLPLVQLGLQVSGLDPSPYMLDIAEKKLGNRVDLHRGLGEDLPFEDNSFNYACLISTMEYVENPRKVIEEASRVAKDKLFISVMNRYAFKGLKPRVKGSSVDQILDQARFFNVWELVRIIRTVSGDVPVSWKTASRIPKNRGKIIGSIQKSKVFGWYPFGTFIGVVVALVPHYRTRPLTIAYSAKP